MALLSILVQGPVNNYSLRHMPEYSKLGSVVVSKWLDDPLGNDIPDCVSKITTNPMPDRKVYSQPTCDFQFWSIYHGLSVVDTPYVVRTRSDEFWNLEPLINRFFVNTDKVVCGNIFFRPWSYMQFHPGDHVFIGRTDLLRDTYRNLCFSPKNPGECAEIALAKEMLKVAGLNETRDDFAKLFDCININELKPFRAVFNGASAVYNSQFDAGTNGSITSMEHL